MAIITFTNENTNETGQTLAASAIATAMAIEHNYKILLISTDFENNSMEECFFNNFKKRQVSVLQNEGRRSGDISGGLEGLIRLFASNRASADMIKSFARPVLKDRLDVLPALKTTDIKEFNNLSVYFSQIAEVAKQAYDIVIVDLSNIVPKENQKKVINLSTLVIVGLTQKLASINNFIKTKQENDFYKKDNVAICIDKYNPESRYTAKNIARYLNEKNTPYAVPYNILFSDNCSEGTIIDYILSIRTLNHKDGKDGYFYECISSATESIDYKRKELEYGRV